MPDLVITASNVRAAGRTTIGTAGEAIITGDVAYYDRATALWMLASAATDNEDTRYGIVVAANGAAGQKIVIAEGNGTIVTLGPVLETGKLYGISATAGKICPVEDLGEGDQLYLLGWASAPNKLTLVMQYTGRVLAAKYLRPGGADHYYLSDGTSMLLRP